MTDPDPAAGPTAGEDPTLRIPDLPTLSRELGSPAFPLRRTGRIHDDATFRIDGGGACVFGGHARGVDRARASALDLLCDLRLEGAAAVASTLTPVGLERRLDVVGAGVVERVVVPRSGPVCFFEWLADAPLPLALTWRVPAPAGATDEGEEAAPGLRWRATDRGLLVAHGADRALYAMSRAPDALEVVPTVSDAGAVVGLRVRARLDLEPGRAFRLAAAGLARGKDEGRVLRVMARSHVVVPTRRADAQRILDDRLSVDAPDASLGEALAWSKLRLASLDPGEDREAGPLGDRAVRLVLAALASGDAAPARAVLAREPAARSGPQPADPDPAAADTRAAGSDLRAAARHLLVTARYLAWTGDLGAVEQAWQGVRARAERCLEALAGAPSAGSGDEIIAGAVRELVVVAEEAGDGPLARRLRAAVGDKELAGPPTRGSTGTGPPAGNDPLLRSAALIEAVVHGLLGAEPDAPRGRLVLRPRLPGSWARFGVRKLALGAAVVELEYDRAGDTHGFTLRQERGAAPLRVILEPELEGRRLVAARVDGEPAGLDPVAVEGRLRVPVQVVLDHERRLEVEIERPDT